MNLVERFTALVTALIASAVWYLACLVPGFLFLGLAPRHTAASPAAERVFWLSGLPFFLFGFALAQHRRSKRRASAGSEKTLRGLGAATGAMDEANFTGGAALTGCLSFLFIASYLPDFVIGAVRVVLGLPEQALPPLDDVDDW